MFALLSAACTDGQSRHEVGANEQPSTAPSPELAGVIASATIASTGVATGQGTTGQPLRHLPAPSLADWSPTFRARVPTEADSEGYSHVAIITSLQVGLFSRPGARWEIGYARIGTRLPARPASGAGCSKGSWYQVTGGAYLCTSEGVHIAEGHLGEAPSSAEVLDAYGQSRVHFADEANPYRYAKATNGAPRLARIPEESEVASVVDGKPPSSLVERWLHGTYLVALGRRIEVAGEVFFETIDGNAIRASDIELRELPPMIGEKLDGPDSLPLAFSFRDSELLCLDEAAAACGTVDKHARFPVEGVVEQDGRELVVADTDLAVPRADLRIVELTERPKGVGAGDKWIHVDLTEQTLTAYEGDDPVYATLVSSGLPDFATPTGLFRVQRKYVTHTMRGKDDDGPYEVGEVPWTLFYDGAYAVHGAYWHNRFGTTKSHGCTNVPPADARWIFHWAEPELPLGWHAAFHIPGTHVYITGETPPDQADGDEAAG